jgi:amino acid transporter
MEKTAYGDVSGGRVSPQLSNIGDVADYPTTKAPLMTRLGLTADSFKRRTLDDKHNQLNQTLKTRHLSMIAIGGSIGAGLFVGSGSALRTGGPAALLIGFAIIGVVSHLQSSLKQKIGADMDIR